MCQKSFITVATLQKAAFFQHGMKIFFFQSMALDGADLELCRPAYELPHVYKQLGDASLVAKSVSDFFVFSHLE